jgi:beta-N-acetylhexosaminidase
MKYPNLIQQITELIMLDIRYFDNDITLTSPTAVRVLPETLKQLFSTYTIGGFILFSENLQDITQIVQLVTSLQIQAPTGFIAIDQEGGIINRIKQSTPTVGNMALGMINNPNITKETAKMIGNELVSLGINVNFAPCADVNSNSLNPIIGVRSFSNDRQVVALHSKAYIAGLKESGIISCAKHFPGHGDVELDSHLGRSCVNKNLQDFATNDLYPFEFLIQQVDSPDMLMTAHIVIPALDNGLIFSSVTNSHIPTPATFSKPIMQHLLREQLNYQGIVISDALDMQAISNYFTPVEASVYALKAGADILLMPISIHNPQEITNFVAYIEQIVQLANTDNELATRITQSYNRVKKLKQQKLLNKITTSSLDIVGCDKHLQFSKLTAQIGIVFNKNSCLPWQNTYNDNILLLSTQEKILPTLQDILKSFGYNNIEIITTYNHDDIMAKIKFADKIVIATYNIKEYNKHLDEIIENLNQLNKLYVVMSCANPYDHLYINNIKTNVLVFGCSGFDQTNYKRNHFTLNLMAAMQLIFTPIN